LPVRGLQYAVLAGVIPVGRGVSTLSLPPEKNLKVLLNNPF